MRLLYLLARLLSLGVLILAAGNISTQTSVACEDCVILDNGYAGCDTGAAYGSSTCTPRTSDCVLSADYCHPPDPPPPPIRTE